MTALTETDLSRFELRVWHAARTGSLVDGRVGDPDIDSVENGSNWTLERTLRAELLVQMLIAGMEPSQPVVRGIRVQGARIVGEFDLDEATLQCPLAITDSYFDNALKLRDASAASVLLVGSCVPGFHAYHLTTRGDVDLSNALILNGEVDLRFAHIGGALLCQGAHMTNTDGPALNGSGAVVANGVYMGKGFAAQGEVQLNGAHIGPFDCDGGRFTRVNGVALSVNAATIEGMFCRDGFVAEGEVQLISAHIHRELGCDGGFFYNEGRYALNASGVTVEGATNLGQHDTAAGEVAHFTANGEVRLIGAHLKGQLFCAGGKFWNSGGLAINAEFIAIDEDMLCGGTFHSTGEVKLTAARVGGQLTFEGSQLENPNGCALNLEGAIVANQLIVKPEVLQGRLNLARARVGGYVDSRATWPESMRLEGFIYDFVDPLIDGERLRWLRLDAKYSPQIYDQLAMVCRRSGLDNQARAVGIAKQRRRRRELDILGKLWSYLLDWTVGYGYRTWQAGAWLVALVVIGAVVFGVVYRDQLQPAIPVGQQPPFQPIIYALDLLLPIVTLHQRDAWIATGPAQWWAVGFTLAGWVLTTAVVASLAGLLNRDKTS